ncbi:MAG: hypothetical protein MUD10_03175 [Candidatus Pacebacteria bacterium]|jgi:heat-inducible transcriptional repressor|nr:hypothetical protein [Candidatus Paceibacterota bacterium]
MQISERQKNILDTIIREYVESAKPVSSQCLGEKYDFGIGPASIRIEMQKLTDDGFLTQPHTSAGRVPTDKGYRFFVDAIAKKENGMVSLDFDLDRLENDFDEIFRSMQDLSRSIANVSESLVLGYLPGEDVMWKEGWEDVLRQPEFNQKDMVENFLDYLHYLESNIGRMKPGDEFELFIGRENPYPKAIEFSTISLALDPAPKQEMILSIIGPKRMAYDRNIALVNRVMKMFDEL